MPLAPERNCEPFSLIAGCKEVKAATGGPNFMVRNHFASVECHAGKFVLSGTTQSLGVTICDSGHNIRRLECYASTMKLPISRRKHHKARLISTNGSAMDGPFYSRIPRISRPSAPRN